MKGFGGSEKWMKNRRKFSSTKIIKGGSTVVPVIFSVSLFTRYQIQLVLVFFGRYIVVL